MCSDRPLVFQMREMVIFGYPELVLKLAAVIITFSFPFHSRKKINLRKNNLRGVDIIDLL